MEGWPSGRRRATRNRLGGAEPSRGFKSHFLRQLYLKHQMCQEISSYTCCGEVAEWSKALAWKVSRRVNPRLEGSNPSFSAIFEHLAAKPNGYKGLAAFLDRFFL